MPDKELLHKSELGGGHPLHHHLAFVQQHIFDRQLIVIPTTTVRTTDNTSTSKRQQTTRLQQTVQTTCTRLSDKLTAKQVCSKSSHTAQTPSQGKLGIKTG